MPSFDCLKVAKKDGGTVVLLCARQYPWCIAQVVDASDGDVEALAKRFRDNPKTRHVHLCFPAGSRDFFVVQASGSTDGHRVEVNQRNHAEVYAAVKRTLQEAADWWQRQRTHSIR